MFRVNFSVFFREVTMPANPFVLQLIRYAIKFHLNYI